MERNTFPGLHRYTVQPRPSRVGRTREVLQPIFFYPGSPSAFAAGFIRKLKTLLVDIWGSLAQKGLDSRIFI
jgi:hypothetical protein